MKENFEDYEEFYISDDPQDIERERKKRNSLLSMFPLLTGGGKDRTKYVISNDSTANSGSGQQLNMQKSTEQKIPGSSNGWGSHTQQGKQTAGNAFKQLSQGTDKHRAPFVDGNHKAKTATVPNPATSSTGKVNDRKEKNNTFSKLRDAFSFATGGYTPHRPVRIGETPWGTELHSKGPIGAVMNYLKMKDIDKWEKENEKENRRIRERLNSMKKWPVAKLAADAYERYLDFKEAREVAIPFKSLSHAFAAADIGLGIDKDRNNLASTSDRFAKEIDKYFIVDDKEDDKRHFSSTLRNALRHTIWQGVLSSQYTPQVAYDVAMSHETRPYADTGRRIFSSEAEADMVTDLLNNVIGRKIGAENRHLSRKQIALLTLEELRKNGLYHYEPCDDGTWRIAKVRISDDVYDAMRRKFSGLNDNGR